jgi:hypothetical protein
MSMHRRILVKGALAAIGILGAGGVTRAQDISLAEPATMRARREFYGASADMRLDVYAYPAVSDAKSGYRDFCAWAMEPDPDEVPRQTDITDETASMENVGSFGDRPASFPIQFGGKADTARWFRGRLADGSGDLMTLVILASNLVHVWRSIEPLPQNLLSEAEFFFSELAPFPKVTYTETGLLDYVPTADEMPYHDVTMTLEQASPLAWRS